MAYEAQLFICGMGSLLLACAYFKSCVVFAKLVAWLLAMNGCPIKWFQICIAFMLLVLTSWARVHLSPSEWVLKWSERRFVHSVANMRWHLQGNTNYLNVPIFQKREIFQDLAPLLWHSFGTIAALLQVCSWPRAPDRIWMLVITKDFNMFEDSLHLFVVSLWWICYCATYSG